MNKSNIEELSVGAEVSSTTAQNKQVTTRIDDTNIIDGFVVGERIVWDSYFGYEIGYFIGKGIMMGTYLIDVCTGLVIGQCSHSVSEVHKYTDELIDSLTKKYGYEKRFSNRF